MFNLARKTQPGRVLGDFFLPKVWLPCVLPVLSHTSKVKKGNCNLWDFWQVWLCTHLPKKNFEQLFGCRWADTWWWRDASLYKSCLVRCLTASAPGPVFIVHHQLCDKAAQNLTEVLQPFCKIGLLFYPVSLNKGEMRASVFALNVTEETSHKLLLVQSLPKGHFCFVPYFLVLVVYAVLAAISSCIGGKKKNKKKTSFGVVLLLGWKNHLLWTWKNSILVLQAVFKFCICLQEVTASSFGLWYGFSSDDFLVVWGSFQSVKEWLEPSSLCVCRLSFDMTPLSRGFSSAAAGVGGGICVGLFLVFFL